MALESDSALVLRQVNNAVAIPRGVRQERHRPGPHRGAARDAGHLEPSRLLTWAAPSFGTAVTSGRAPALETEQDSTAGKKEDPS
jgi:hypothetical protein